MSVKKRAVPVPTEAQEQIRICEWASWAQGIFPELRLMYHIPNGGTRYVVEAVNLKRQGVRRGVPDICLPVARGGYHGLYIELKRAHGGHTSKQQDDWLMMLTEQGYKAEVCHGADTAISLITWYLGGAENG